MVGFQVGQEYFWMFRVSGRVINEGFEDFGVMVLFQIFMGWGCWIWFGFDGFGIEQWEFIDGCNWLFVSGKMFGMFGVEFVEFGVDMVVGEGGSYVISSFDGLEFGLIGIF